MNELTVLGFGQCGSKIAIEVSASFNPASVIEGVGPVALSFRFLYERFKPSTTQQGDGCPQVYIADLNAVNDVYVQYMKMEAIRSLLATARPKKKKLTTSDMIARVNAGNPKVKLQEEDSALVKYVEKNSAALSMINALYFSAPDHHVLHTGGVGGQQYISEIIADQDVQLLQSIETNEDTLLVGVFSLGGGTGSGSLYSILSKHKESHYTVGVGVLPERFNKHELANAGRYITKFLGADPAMRFNTLLLFSNQAAISLLEQTKLPKGASPQAIMNEYVASFIHDFSLLTNPRTVTLAGKLFDPADAKRFLSDICTVGYAVSPEKFSAKEMFVNAVSPMSYSNEDGISGVAVSTSPIVGSEPRHGLDLRKMIVEAINGLDRKQGSSDVSRAMERLRKEGTFYRTIKSVYVFFFLSKRSHEADVFMFSRIVKEFFMGVAGSDVSMNVCTYFIDSLQRSSTLVLFSGFFSYEMYESTLTFVGERFIPDQDKKIKFRDSYNEVLKSVKEDGWNERDGGVEKQIKDILDDVCGGRRKSPKEKVEETPNFLRKDTVGSIVQAKRQEKLVTRSAVSSVLVELARRFQPGNERLLLSEAPLP